ncbi:hypothetical protein NLU13_1098 [Sarocladium strictum]|uniref:chitinase n=1 Tax=Sarocladium strictum TaxID=5046 RepID=A0AA39GQA6_SARSR|nr:hypothetical protein NLU13_1098 [Sarocladium strictum]
MKTYLLSLFLLVGCLIQLSIQQQCSASKHCPEGCCSSAGYCGYGPDYCGKGCQSTCDRKSQCNPGWKSTEFSEGDKCPLNVCCSKHGFCGYTEDFCKDDKVQRPKCSPNEKPINRVIGYFEAWAPSKRSCYSMLPTEIPYGQYTDVIFSFATINPESFQVSAGDSQTKYLLTQMQSLKIIQPDIKIWVALGGWAFNDPGPTQTTFSDIASSSKNTNIFLDSLVFMMTEYSLDGVDIDWEYPAADDRNGKPEDYKNIVTFMKKLRSRMRASKKSTSMAIPASYWYLQNFDIRALESEVDWFNLMSYDMHGAWDINNKWTGPWANSHTNMTEIQLALDLLWRNDISPSKVTMGMAFYSRTFTLTDPTCNKPGCRISSGGNSGECSDTVGVLLHPEIADTAAKKKISPILDRNAMVKTVSWENQWTSFDDLVTWRLKANAARSQCIQGFMVWAMSQDDKKGTNIRALNSALGRKTPDFPDFTPNKPVKPMPASKPKLCRWTSCFEGCPAGFKEVQRDGHKEIMMNREQCSQTTSYSQVGFVRLCCPSDHKQPTCTWRGHRNSGNCKPGCNDDEVELGSVQGGCKKNYQSACCTKSAVTEAYGECFWTDCIEEDTAKNICGDRFMASSPQGWGGQKYCKKGKTRSLCCSEPPPAAFNTKCKWYAKVGHLKGGGLDALCEGACPDDHVLLARTLASFEGKREMCYGDSAFCCPDPKHPRRDDEYEEDTLSQATAKQFKKLLEKYVDSPTCPRETINPIIHDDRSRGYGHGKRDISTVLSSQTCTLGDWNTMIATSYMMFSVSYIGFDIVRRYYDEIFASAYSRELEYAPIAEFLAMYPNLDAGAHMEYVYMNPTRAAAGMRQMIRTAQLCTNDLSGDRRIRKRSLALRDPGSLVSAAQVTKRIVFTMQTVEDSLNQHIPSLLTIFRAIRDGRLTLHYARWEWASGQGSNAVSGPLLELAYWIGGAPGTDEDTTGYSDYDALRDNRIRYHAGPDRWIVFHIHFERQRVDRNGNWVDTGDEDSWPRTFERSSSDNRVYIGTPTISVFHAQQWDHDVARVAADQGDATARRTWECPRFSREERGFWYIGSDMVFNSEDAELAEELAMWGSNLYDEGYVAHAGLRLILSPPTGDAVTDDIDPDRPGWVAGRNSYTEAAGNMSPYERNWLIVDGRVMWGVVMPSPPFQ